ncbi:hypothetical protein QWW44_08270 [Neisseria gonorrhoeae]
MVKKTGLDNFVLEYKKLSEEVALLREQQKQQSRFFENLALWLVKVGIHNQSTEQIIELVEIADNFYLNGQTDFGCDDFGFWQKLDKLIKDNSVDDEPVLSESPSE